MYYNQTYVSNQRLRAFFIKVWKSLRSVMFMEGTVHLIAQTLLILEGDMSHVPTQYYIQSLCNSTVY